MGQNDRMKTTIFWVIINVLLAYYKLNDREFSKLGWASKQACFTIKPSGCRPLDSLWETLEGGRTQCDSDIYQTVTLRKRALRWRWNIHRSELCGNNSSQYMHGNYSKSMFRSPLIEQEVSDINNLKNSTSTSHDNLPVKIIKCCNNELIYYYYYNYYYCNQSINLDISKAQTN